MIEKPLEVGSLCLDYDIKINKPISCFALLDVVPIIEIINEIITYLKNSVQILNALQTVFTLFPIKVFTRAFLSETRVFPTIITSWTFVSNVLDDLLPSIT